LSDSTRGTSKRLDPGKSRRARSGCRGCTRPGVPRSRARSSARPEAALWRWVGSGTSSSMPQRDEARRNQHLAPAAPCCTVTKYPPIRCRTGTKTGTTQGLSGPVVRAPRGREGAQCRGCKKRVWSPRQRTGFVAFGILRVRRETWVGEAPSRTRLPQPAPGRVVRGVFAPRRRMETTSAQKSTGEAHDLHSPAFIRPTPPHVVFMGSPRLRQRVLGPFRPECEPAVY
jgi:hypothetical protein